LRCLFGYISQEIVRRFSNAEKLGVTREQTQQNLRQKEELRDDNERKLSFDLEL